MQGKRTQGKASGAIGATMRPYAFLAAGLVLVAGVELRAQEAATAPQPPSELEKALGIRTDVPEAKGFVQGTRPAPEGLAFGTPYATDKSRPRPRSKAEVEALRRDLEAAGARNRARSVETKSAGAASPARTVPPR